MTKNIKIKIIILIVFLTACLSLIFVYKNTQKQNLNLTQNIPPPNLPLSKGEEEGRIGTTKTTLDINGTSYEDEIVGEISVYDFMSKLRNEGKINFIEKNYPVMGKFIEEINGIKNSGKQGWIYYVNGVEAQVGVSNYKIKSGDIVSWKYEKSNY
jgi:hypothetical protein